jgi:hypothetical protein
VLVYPTLAFWEVEEPGRICTDDYEFWPIPSLISHMKLEQYKTLLYQQEVAEVQAIAGCYALMKKKQP